MKTTKFTNAKKLLNQKNYIMKNKKITEMEIEEIQKQMREDRRSHVKDFEG